MFEIMSWITHTCTGSGFEIQSKLIASIEQHPQMSGRREGGHLYGSVAPARSSEPLSGIVVQMVQAHEDSLGKYLSAFAAGAVGTEDIMIGRQLCGLVQCTQWTSEGQVESASWSQ